MEPQGNIVVDIAGEIVCGEPLKPTAEQLSIPRRIIEPDELVYRVVFAFTHIQPGHYAIAELRSHATTAEMVLASFKGKIYLGRWWAKHGARELIVDPSLKPMRGVQILAVVNFIFAP
jgi:hypothetical protein